jgi:hypothetical protein
MADSGASRLRVENSLPSVGPRAASSTTRALQAAAAALFVHALVLGWMAWRPIAGPEVAPVALEVELSDRVPEPEMSLEDQIRARIEDRIAGQVANLRADGTRALTDEALQSGREPSARDLAQIEQQVRAEGQALLQEAMARRQPTASGGSAGNPSERERLESYAGWDKQYAGEVTVRFVLPGREAVYLDVPSYRCKEGGKVIVEIEVDASGRVVDAVLAGGSGGAGRRDAQSEGLRCVDREALKSALASRFNRAAPGTAKARGTLTYVFQAQ